MEKTKDTSEIFLWPFQCFKQKISLQIRDQFATKLAFRPQKLIISFAHFIDRSILCSKKIEDVEIRKYIRSEVNQTTLCTLMICEESERSHMT